jgi:hypothetical protein
MDLKIRLIFNGTVPAAETLHATRQGTASHMDNRPWIPRSSTRSRSTGQVRLTAALVRCSLSEQRVTQHVGLLAHLHAAAVEACRVAPGYRLIKRSNTPGYSGAVREVDQWCVVTGLSCPSHSAMTLMSTPACSKRMAVAWRLCEAFHKDDDATDMIRARRSAVWTNVRPCP